MNNSIVGREMAAKMSVEEHLEYFIPGRVIARSLPIPDKKNEKK
jgi:hypothetical protein